ncbi:hypothetical protein BJV82DRAFT_667590 [Fennellomyces sp. T-0311]|nr:hypothetical protein BJV82DRAFT_667590 [Fennellomyces sp. T-0311]
MVAIGNKDHTQQQKPQDGHFERSRAALCNGDIKDSINIATQGYNEIVHTQLLNLLNIRSTAFEKQGLLSRALEDAETMIRLSSTSPLGYLRAGNVYTTSGQAHMAVDIYKQGLAMVPAANLEWVILRVCKQQASSRKRARFDIVGKLPLEIVHKIFENVDDIAMCTAVPLVSKYVQHLAFGGPSSSNALDMHYLKFIMNGLFTNLTSLALQGQHLVGVRSKDIEKLLLLLENTLKTLKISEFSYSNFPLKRILVHCRNLRELSCEAMGNIQETWFWAAEYLPKATCQKLINLELTYNETTYLALSSHLMFCPNLTRLVIRTPNCQPLDQIQISTFTPYFPKLKTVGINCSTDIPDLNCSFDGKNGLSFMNIGFYNYTTLYESKAHVEANSGTLETLHLEYTDYGWTRSFFEMYPHLAGLGSDINDLPPLTRRRDDTQRGHHLFYPRPDTEYSNLKHLHYKSDKTYIQGLPMRYTADNARVKSHVENFIIKVIQKSPALTTLSLSNDVIRHRETWETLAMAVCTRKLESLRFECMSFEWSDEDDYRRFFSSLNQVHTLEIINCRFFVNSLLIALASSESIQSLTLAKNQSFTMKGMTEFLKQVSERRSHRLHHLNLVDIGIPLDQNAVQYLLAINGLQTLSFNRCSRITAEIAEYLLNNLKYSSLEKIEFLHCIRVGSADEWSNATAILKDLGITLSVE